MGCRVLDAEGRASGGGGSCVPGDQVFDRVAGERGAAAGGEERIAGAATAFLHPGFQDCRGLPGQRCGSLFPALAGASDVGAGAELDVLVAQAGELGDAQAGLGGDVEQGVIPPSGPGVLAWSGYQGFELGMGQVADLVVLAALGRDGQDAGDEAGWGAPGSPGSS